MWEQTAGVSGVGWGLGSAITTLMFFLMTLRSVLPYLSLNFDPHEQAEKLLSKFYPFVEISLSEYTDAHRFKRNPAFAAISAYLSAACSSSARRLLAELPHNSAQFALTLDHNQQVSDLFHGHPFWWRSSLSKPKSAPLSLFSSPPDERRYVLSFHRRHRRLAQTDYLDFVVRRGNEILAARRQRRLFTNGNGGAGGNGHGGAASPWCHVPFEHPATFDTLAMDPAEKAALVRDLLAFKNNREYYSRVGKVWKRGYLLYGPPGTGKSSAVAAMANLLEYDVYDLELTAVKDNAALRRLLIETTPKSIIVVEDIDCSLDLAGGPAGRRRRVPAEAAAALPEAPPEEDGSRVTLSGLLNFIDGLWSACAAERIVVVTTNHVDKLDPALIRRGRMDLHVELSYCRFEAFKVLAKNYLGVESHVAFEEVRRLIAEVDITPADVAELLMGGEAEECLRGLVAELERRAAATSAGVVQDGCEEDNNTL